jgi:clan AA aspartic protease (TIGR02281 family)
MALKTSSSQASDTQRLVSGFAAAVIALGLASPALAGNSIIPGIVGGIMGGMIQNAIQQQQMQQQYQQRYQQQYYQQQQQQQYYQQQQVYRQQQQIEYQQQQLESQRQRRQAASRQQNARRQQATKQRPAEETRAQPVSLPESGTPDTVTVPLKKDGGTFKVPVRINESITIDFVVDSGAATVTLPEDVVKTLLRTGTLSKKDIIKTQNFQVADGRQLKGLVFKLARLQVGNHVLHDVVASTIAGDGEPLLGQSFLSKFASFTQNNADGTLILKLPGAGTASPSTESAQAAQPAKEAPAAAAPEAAQPSPKTVLPGPNEAGAGERKDGPVISAAAEATKPQAEKSPAAVPTFPNKTAYADARRRLLVLGYAPAPLPGSGQCDSATDKTCFPEREACATAGQCTYIWRRGETLIVVEATKNSQVVAAVSCQANCP